MNIKISDEEIQAYFDGSIKKVAIRKKYKISEFIINKITDEYRKNHFKCPENNIEKELVPVGIIQNEKRHARDYETNKELIFMSNEEIKDLIKSELSKKKTEEKPFMTWEEFQQTRIFNHSH